MILDVPERFLPDFEDTAGDNYVREAVPKGQSVRKWSEMITMTANKNAAGYAKALAKRIIPIYGEDCAQTYTVVNLTPLKVRGAKAVAAVYLGCGDLGGYSEAMVFVTVDGADNL